MPAATLADGVARRSRRTRTTGAARCRSAFVISAPDSGRVRRRGRGQQAAPIGTRWAQRPRISLRFVLGLDLDRDHRGRRLPETLASWRVVCELLEPVPHRGFEIVEIV